MTIKTPLHPQTESPAIQQTEPDWSLGWREEVVTLPDGSKQHIQTPLTPEERLHPEESFVIPEPRFQDIISRIICEMLIPYLTHIPHIIVARNLLIKWDKPELKKHAPDVCVIPHVKDPTKNWGTFFVEKEGTRPILVIEVVSTGSKEDDRVTKVADYALAGVQGYVYIDYWHRKGQTSWEIAGFRLHGDRYLPMLPDEDGAIYCETVQVRMGWTTAVFGWKTTKRENPC